MMKEFFYDRRGIYYRTNIFEPGRQTVVFIHGLSASSVYWTEYEEIFKSKYNILTYDLRGHGKSRKPTKYSDYDIIDFSEDIFDLMKNVGIDKCILVSHSFGTLIAIEFLTAHQDMLSGVVFLSPGLSIAGGFTGFIMRCILSLARILELFPTGSKTGEHIDYKKFKGTGDWNVRRLWADVIHSTGLRVYLYTLRHVYFFNRDNTLEKIHVPTLIVHGRRDTYFPIKNSILIKNRIKDSEFVIIENADHIIVLNNVKEVSAAITRFLERIKMHSSKV